METDYDTPRRSADEPDDTPPPRRVISEADWDAEVAAEAFELPGADLSGEEFTVRVVPEQSDEFTCTSCFLVHHRSRRAHGSTCLDCA